MSAEEIKQDFESALIKHVLFKTKLRSFLYGTGTSEGPIRDAELCALGQWIRARRAGAYAHLEAEMSQLDRLHRQLHERANRLMDLRLAGQPDAASAGLAELLPLAEHVTTLLTTLQARLQTEVRRRAAQP